jgi:DNA-binding transcriptional MocR family regulator
VQLAICHLPRVEDRLLSLFWLLAESWGRVTSSGTALPLVLTHETLGALIGARRPTVTLALGELAERGAILRQGRTWLLVEQPAAPTSATAELHAPELLGPGPSLWGVRETPAPAELDHEQIAEHLGRLHAEHVESSARIVAGLATIRTTRARSQALREEARTTRDALSRSPAPS